MTHAILDAVKTARQALATAGLLGAAFALPTLMAAGVGGLPSPSMDDVTWMGTGGDDPVVHLSIDDIPDPDARDARDQDGAETGSADADADGESVADADTRAAPRSPGKAATEVHAASPERTDLAKAVHHPDADSGRLTGVALREKHKARRMALRAERAKTRGQRCSPDIDGIDHIYGERYRVERAVLDKYSTLEEAMKMARVAWHKDERGKNDGFRITRVACGSPLSAVGLRRGDVIHRINGRTVRTIPQAFNAVRKIKRHDVIRVELSRGGRDMTIVAMVD